MKLHGKRILVTGADGFIGSHLTEHLVRLGHEVRAFVLYNSFNSWGWLEDSPPEIKESLDVFAGDIRDPYGIRQAMQGCDVVLHLAALIGIPYSYHSPEAYVETNIRGTLNVVQAGRELGVAKIVCTSTSEVYGTACRIPITEEHPLQGQSPYAATKIGADHIAMSFYTSFDTPVAIIRPFNTYGPRQSARAVIPTVITQLLEGRQPVRLGSLHPTRDFNYIEDIVRAFVAVAEEDAAVGQVINIGGGFEISIGDLAAVIAELIGMELVIETDTVRLRPDRSEVERLCADNTKALELLGWRPRFGGSEGLRRGLGETIAWFSARVNRERYKAHSYTI